MRRNGRCAVTLFAWLLLVAAFFVVVVAFGNALESEANARLGVIGRDEIVPRATVVPPRTAIPTAWRRKYEANR